MQERAIIAARNQEELAPALLFYGCRDPADDDLYRDEFDAWEQLGAVTVYRAHSRQSDAAEGCRYVQDRLWRERDAVGALWSGGDARIYICGSSKIANAAKEALVCIMQSESTKRGQTMSNEEALEWFDTHRNERFATDVFD